ncbi:MAG: DNA methylase [Chloroflexi bacterium]|nr:DNA methylase [Chloroflexota bacterium]
MDEATRAAYRERLRQYLQDPAFRAIEGFPIGEDEAILDLSDPPYYTACPNPFLPEIIAQWQAERAAIRGQLGLPDDSHDNGHAGIADGQEPVYHREPFAADVSEGKNDPIYNAHSYHTKVPHKAIMRYILHYTDPGDIVFDGFCGTGMTGVAAQLCGDRKAVEDLGYRVDAEGYIVGESNKQSDPDGQYAKLSHNAGYRLGARKAALVDLSPAATFISYNYNTPVDVSAFEMEAKRILSEVEKECGWMYETWHPHCDDPNRVKGKINYTVWSDIFVCSQCGAEMVFWDVAVDKQAGKVLDSFPCPACDAEQTKRSLERAWVATYDRALNRTIRLLKQAPVLINYSLGNRRYEKVPDSEDLSLVQKIENYVIPQWFPTNRMPEGDESRRNDAIGVTHVHHFYSRRNLSVLAAVWDHSRSLIIKWLLTSIMPRANKQHQIAISRVGGEKKDAGGKTAGHRRGTLYIPSNQVEFSVFLLLEERLRVVKKTLNEIQNKQLTVLSTQSAQDLYFSNSSIDYIFVDPPFGANIMYSELNFIWDAWLQIPTNNKPEAIVNQTQGKNLFAYQRLMQQCFQKFYDILKPGRWMTVEFHNSQNSVWNSIQESILRAGFVIADIRFLDKQKKTHTQVTAIGSVKQDLVISAYKPRASFEQRFLEEAGTPGGAWDFVRQHLAQLPTVVEEKGILEIIAERQSYLLFDRMVAFHIQRGATVPLSAAEFYAGLRQRFVERDGMFFLPEQVVEYDRARLQASRVAQLSLFVSDEKSAIQWLRQQLDALAGGQPQTYQEIQPLFLRQLHQARHEALPELGAILEQNFLQDAEGRWYVPDPNRASDLEKLRQKALLREFAEYVAGRGRLRQFRTEAVRAGFAEAWQRRDYQTIVRVAERLPEAVLQEDLDLLMYYDNASLRVG